MKKEAIIGLMVLVIFLFASNGVIAVTYSCGDDICTTDVSGYQENNPLHITYCPMDCGGFVDKDWCKRTYNLINQSECTACPACPTCSTCPICSICPTCSTCPICSICPTCKTCEVCDNSPTLKTNTVTGINTSANTSAYSCGGCQMEDKYYPLGYRLKGEYCSASEKFISQVELDQTCENNFECKNNVCISGKCKQSFSIVNWFKNLFGRKQ